MKRRNELLNYTYKKYNPDFIFPLDADEFIATDKNVNPRKLIEKLEPKCMYKYRMKNYILNGKESKVKFIPDRIDTLRITQEEAKYSYKCIAPGKIEIDDVNLAMGAHTLYDKDGKELPFKKTEDIYLAHYPVRSSTQIMSKVIIGRLNYSKLNSREEGGGFHQFEILDEIIDNGSISAKTLLDISKFYSLKDHNQTIKTEKKPIDTKFCKKLTMKYTDDSTSDKVLINTLISAFSIINEMREDMQKVIKENDDIINSKGWQLLEKIRRIKKIGK